MAASAKENDMNHALQADLVTCAIATLPPEKVQEFVDLRSFSSNATGIRRGSNTMTHGRMKN